MSRAPSIRTSKNSTLLPRRTFLRGVLGGTALALALPTLESMVGRHGTAYADGTPFPKRFGTWFWGNGVVRDLWVPATTGSFALSEQLQPFANVKEYLSVVSGMNNVNAANNAHCYGPAFILTGDLPETNGIFGGGPARRPTVDQLIANAVGTTTAHRSIQVGVVRYAHDGPNSAHILDNISYSGPGTPLRADHDPASVFDRLFGPDFKLPPTSGQPTGPTARERMRSKVLDAVQDDAAKLRERLGQHDRERLEQHLDAIRGIQKRLAAITPPSAACKKPGLGPYEAGNTAKLLATTDVMSEIVRMALACDLTRVFAFQWSTPAAHAAYPEVNINESFHESCHLDASPHAVYNRGVKFIMQNFAGLLEKLKATPEGAGNLLDSACIMGTSCIAMQTAESGHVSEDWPLLVAGRAGGALKSAIHYRSTTNENAQKVPLTCMKAMGLNVNEWGVDSLYVNQPVSALLA